MQLLIVGEHLHPDDEGTPFNSPSNKLFKGWMRQVGLDPRDAHFTNVISTPVRSMLEVIGDKASSIPGTRYVQRGKYLDAKFFPQVVALHNLVNRLRPNLVLACGDLAMWALTSESAMKFARGRITSGIKQIEGRKVLPCFSPRQVIIEWPNRPILLADLDKAKREMQFPEIVRPERTLLLHPTLDDMENFLNEHLLTAEVLSCDIETKGKIITCFGVAPSSSLAMVVPFFDQMKKDGNYWPTHRDEYIAWNWVRRVLKLPGAVIGQNFQYDMQYLWRFMGIKSPSFRGDTMLLHHALQPEMLKGLSFLASVYTDELSWKFMAKVSASDREAKRGDLE